MNSTSNKIAIAFQKAFLLTLLILMSSCTTRNGIQAYFDVPATKTLNISKSAAIQLCADVLHKSNVSSVKKAVALPTSASANSSVTIIGSVTNKHASQYSKAFRHSSVPIYILFGRLKIFS